MPDFNYSGLKDNVTESLPPHHDQPGEQSHLLPFSGKLVVDVELKLKNENFKQTIQTTVSNSSKANGYFGAAYWHPKHQQVVVARSTDPTNVGALWTDLSGVLLNHYVLQMGSASSFAHKVVEVLQSVNETEGVSFQLFFTGHSLGGWLAQITNFTTKYLQVGNNTFLKSDNIPLSYHPHTLVLTAQVAKICC
jgi:hypothetical protein